MGSQKLRRNLFRTEFTHFITVAKRPNLKTLNQDSKSKIKEEQVEELGKC